MQHHSQQSSGIYPSTNAGTIFAPPTYGNNEGCYAGGPPFVSNIPTAYNSVNGGATGNSYNDSLNSSHHYNGGSGTGPYIAPHRGIPPPIGMCKLI